MTTSASPRPASPRPAAPRPSEAARSARHRAILALVKQAPIGSQEELAIRLRERGFTVTQATISRDIADLGLVKALRGDRHAYVPPTAYAPSTAYAPPTAPGGGSLGSTHAGTARLHRILADYPVRIARSGLSLVLISTSGTAAVIAQAIDESNLDDQVGTLAGDNTLLVLFADEPALERWRAEFGAILQQATAGLDGEDLAGTYP
jgi:transcriptional regulator of arginine metabolism